MASRSRLEDLIMFPPVLSRFNHLPVWLLIVKQSFVGQLVLGLGVQPALIDVGTHVDAIVGVCSIDSSIHLVCIIKFGIWGI